MFLFFFAILSEIPINCFSSDSLLVSPFFPMLEFTEKLFSSLKRCKDKLSVRLLIMDCISRFIGTHELFLLPFYSHIQKMMFPRQEGVLEYLLFRCMFNLVFVVSLFETLSVFLLFSSASDFLFVLLFLIIRFVCFDPSFW